MVYETRYIKAEDREAALAEPIQIRDGNSTTTAQGLTATSDISTLKVNLRRIPVLGRGSIVDGLTRALEPYGDIHVMGIYLDKETQVFKGEGMVILDIGRSRASLTRQIPVPQWNKNISALWKGAGF
ncbi:hypothetical protein EDD21DRAFT_365598 [Dissophora ornata]|nr:hypothetical protein EDD21DRAFT_365598 [Dissophora ornata]